MTDYEFGTGRTCQGAAAASTMISLGADDHESAAVAAWVDGPVCGEDDAHEHATERRERMRALATVVETATPIGRGMALRRALELAGVPITAECLGYSMHTDCLVPGARLTSRADYRAERTRVADKLVASGVITAEEARERVLPVWDSGPLP